MRKVVVLPAPLGPKRATISPGLTVNERLQTTVLEPYRLVTASSAIMGRMSGAGKKPGGAPLRYGASRSDLPLAVRAVMHPLLVRHLIMAHENLPAFEIADALQLLDGAHGIRRVKVGARHVAVQILLHPDRVASDDDR